MTRRLLLLGALALVPLAVQPSSASFVASSTNAASTFATAADFNTVAVALADPGTPLQGSVALTATASSDRGIQRVRFQVSPAGAGTWADACEATSAPYTCAWDTNGDDGLVDVRAIARDDAGYERTAVRTSRRVDNAAPSVSLANPGTSLKGSVNLTVTATDAGVGLAADGVIVEYKPSAGSTWTEICHRSSTGTCTWGTGGVTDGDYDLRARAADTLGHAATSAVLGARRVDNAVPTASIPSPPPPVTGGTVTLTATATDSGSGVQKVVFEARPAGTPTWYAVCEKTSAPYTCSANSSGYAPDGDYEVRAVTYDNAGNTTPSAIYPLKIDNTAPTGAVTAPILAGTVTLTTTAADATSGVASVRFERRTAGNPNVWSELCTDAVAPFTCDWAVPAGDQQWDLRVIITDRAGNTATSATLTRPGGTRPAGTDVQGANGGVAGTLDAGDTFTFTYGEAVTPMSLAGWNGTGTTAVTIRVADGGTRDTLTVWNAGNTAVTGLATELQLDRDVVAAAGARLAGTLELTGAQAKLTVGGLTSGGITPAAGAATLVWTPSAAALDAAGLAALATPVTESGAGDADL